MIKKKQQLTGKHKTINQKDCKSRKWRNARGTAGCSFPVSERTTANIKALQLQLRCCISSWILQWCFLCIDQVHALTSRLARTKAATKLEWNGCTLSVKCFTHMSFYYYKHEMMSVYLSVSRWTTQIPTGPLELNCCTILAGVPIRSNVRPTAVSTFFTISKWRPYLWRHYQKVLFVELFYY